MAELAPVYREACRTLGLKNIYFIQAGADGPIKIGIARRVDVRLRTLQTANAQRLRLLGVYRGLALEEKQLHADFASSRIGGEWFHPTPELLHLVSRIAEPWDDEVDA